MTALTRRLERLAIVRSAPTPASTEASWDPHLFTDDQIDVLKRLSLRHAEGGLDGLTDDELDELLNLVEITHGRDH